MSTGLDWEAPELSSEDQRLVSEYKALGRPLDDLAYTEDFEKLVKDLGYPDTLQAKHAVFQRLLRLRKKGRLPRLVSP